MHLVIAPNDICLAYDFSNSAGSPNEGEVTARRNPNNLKYGFLAATLDRSRQAGGNRNDLSPAVIRIGAPRIYLPTCTEQALRRAALLASDQH